MSIETLDIPRSQWQNSLIDLSRQYQGWAVILEEMLGELGDQYASKEMPLQGLSLETKGSEKGDILVELGDSPHEYMVHHVDHPSALRVTVTKPGDEADNEIESEDGTTTIVRLRRREALPGQTKKDMPAKRSGKQARRP